MLPIKAFCTASRSVLSISAIVVSLAIGASSANFRVVYDFNQASNVPTSGLVFDTQGNAYGSMGDGSLQTGGLIYQLSPVTGFHVIYKFNLTDGLFPAGNLALDSAGNLYGSTIYGGPDPLGCGGGGCGVVFELSPPQHGGLWSETILYSFDGSGLYGANPVAGVTLGLAG